MHVAECHTKEDAPRWYWLCGLWWRWDVMFYRSRLEPWFTIGSGQEWVKMHRFTGNGWMEILLDWHLTTTKRQICEEWPLRGLWNWAGDAISRGICHKNIWISLKKKTGKTVKIGENFTKKWKITNILWAFFKYWVLMLRFTRIRFGIAKCFDIPLIRLDIWLVLVIDIAFD